jgi:glutamyl-tRNA synthetase
MEDVRREILRWALSNAIEHQGKADAKVVLKKLLAELPGWKSRVRELTGLVQEIVLEVNQMDLESQRSRLEKLGRVERPKPEQRRGLPELPHADEFKLVVTRFAPNPNGPLHLGNARAAILSYEYARRYGGKFILRFEDTNPENVLPEMYEFIKRDLRWLGLSWDEEHAQSERLNIYYEFTERLLKSGDAYVCTCETERFRELRNKMKACPCRSLPPRENREKWNQMLAGDFLRGEAVVRVKTDLSHPNPAVRDWPACRVVDHPHPRVGRKYRAWPLYNFSVSIDDHEMGVTHIFRGKEHEVNEQRQRTLYQKFGWGYPVAVQYGRLSIPGAVLSKTETVRAVREGRLSGYDDVRLATLAALRRRGISPEAIRRVILGIGLTPVDASLSWESISAHNRKLIDAKASRYFFVPDPVKLKVRGAPQVKEARLRSHPSDPEAGERILPLDSRDDTMVFQVPRADIEKLEKGDIFRLKDLMNVKLISKGKELNAEFLGFGVIQVPKIQWTSRGALPMEIVMPDASTVKGVVEPAIAGAGAGAIVQLERFGFARVEKLGPKVVAVFGHK